LKPLVLSLALLLGTTAYAQSEPSLRVGKVTIHPLDVYSPAEVERGRPYALADRLHIETKPAVIEQFLLFHEGEPYRPERLAETERNLRKLGFLKSASVVPSEPHDGLVDVTVTTQDSWSIAPETEGGSAGGKTTYGFDLSEGNLLGLGKEVEIGWHKELDRTRLLLNYNDPAFFAPYWKAHGLWGSNSDGYQHEVSIGRPFYSFITPTAVQFNYEGFRRDNHLYGDSFQVAQFQQQHKLVAASYGHALDADDNHARRLVGGIRFFDDRFAPRAGERSGVLPSDRLYRYVFLRYETAENDFLKVNFVNKDLRVEDFNLGRTTSLEAAISPRRFGAANDSAQLRAGASDGRRVGEDGFVMGGGSVSTRVDGGLQHLLTGASVAFVRRNGATHPSTFLARLTASSGWRMDRDVQFFADGLNGLRGYRAYAFEGSRAVILNVEQRLYLGREILQLASPGIVAFFDAGNATSGGFRELMHVKSDVGIGLRIGLPRTPKNLLRIDLAYALNRDPRGRKGLLVSVSSGQAF
jgi:hypothetical protein